MSSKSSISRSFFMLLFLLCTSVLSVNATINMEPKKLDSLNIVTFIGTQHYPIPITPQLMSKEAELALKSLPSGKRKPAVVSALWAGGDKVFFASSAKGKGTVHGQDDLNIPSAVREALVQCAADVNKHNYDGKCGEIMVIAEWLREHPGQSLPRNKLIVAVNDRGVVPPCDARQGTYGCTQFLQKMKFDGSEIIGEEPAEACELAPPGSPKGSLGKRACRRPSKGSKPTKAPKKGNVSKPKGAKPAPRRPAARPISRRPKHRRSVQPRLNGWMTQ